MKKAVSRTRCSLDSHIDAKIMYLNKCTSLSNYSCSVLGQAKMLFSNFCRCKGHADMLPVFLKIVYYLHFTSVFYTHTVFAKEISNGTIIIESPQKVK